MEFEKRLEAFHKEFPELEGDLLKEGFIGNAINKVKQGVTGVAQGVAQNANNKKLIKNMSTGAAFEPQKAADAEAIAMANAQDPTKALEMLTGIINLFKATVKAQEVKIAQAEKEKADAQAKKEQEAAQAKEDKANKKRGDNNDNT